MKTLKTLLLMIVISGMAVSSMAQGQKAQGQNNSWGIGIRQHADQPKFPDIPFGDDDLSFGLTLEARDSGGYWQGVLLYTPDIKSINELDYALTPQLNLIFSENAWRMGVGGSRTYIKSEIEKGWRDFHWQMLLGIGLPGVGKTMRIELQAIYVFDKLSNVSDFSTKNLEYALWIGFPL